MIATGLFKPPNGRTGVFITNADAIVLAADLRHAIEWGASIPWTARKKLEELAELLESVKAA